MKRLLILALVLLLGGFTNTSFAQQKGQQQHLQQKQQMMQKMNGLMERTQQMNQRMQLTLGNLINAADHCNMMLQDRDMIQERQMQQDMNQLRQHLLDMTGQPKEAVQTLEYLTQRLHQQEKTRTEK